MTLTRYSEVVRLCGWLDNVLDQLAAARGGTPGQTLTAAEVVTAGRDLMARTRGAAVRQARGTGGAELHGLITALCVFARMFAGWPGYNPEWRPQ